MATGIGRPLAAGDLWKHLEFADFDLIVVQSGDDPLSCAAANRFGNVGPIRGDDGSVAIGVALGRIEPSFKSWADRY